ncbi:hypothetical protein [Curvibacter gracilis]|uniref:hypothetical protein n=1 Tax=Curvibacter gracilis TaxID=230310 RepID=UPI0004869EBC|nr:hypothetical protein [Curvibacter gracilis]
MSVEDEREGSPPTEAEIAAWKADQAACRAETFARCKQQGACAEPHGSRWQLLVQEDERAGKCAGRCPCEETTQRAITLECDFSLTSERQEDGTWKPGQPATITFLPEGAQ